MDSIRFQVVHHLSNHPSMTFQFLVKFAQGLGNTYRAARRTTSRVEFEDWTSRTKRPAPRSVLSVETSSAPPSSDSHGADQDGILAIESQDGRSYSTRHGPSFRRRPRQGVARPIPRPASRPRRSRLIPGGPSSGQIPNRSWRHPSYALRNLPRDRPELPHVTSSGRTVGYVSVLTRPKTAPKYLISCETSSWQPVNRITSQGALKVRYRHNSGNGTRTTLDSLLMVSPSAPQ